MSNSFIENIAICNNFDAESEHIKKRGGIDLQKNKLISSLVNPFELAYHEDIERVTEVLKDECLAKYQHNLISKRLKEISVDTIDVDKIEITLSLTNNFLKEILDVDDGFSKVGVKAKRGRLSVIAHKTAGTKNRGFSKRHNKPYFTHKYSIILDDDTYRSVEFYVADLNHPNNKGRKNVPYNVEINFIPTRFSLEQISLIFWHIKSKLKNTRYDRVMNRAGVRRFDIGYMIYGVSQLFGFAVSSNNNFKYGASYPDDEEVIQQTSYIGRLENNNRVTYEKVLKEFKFFVKYKGDSFDGHDFSDLAPEIDGLEEWYNSRVSTFRVEARHIADKELYSLRKLTDGDKCGLTDIRILKPKYLMMLPKDMLRTALLNKTLVRKKAIFDYLMELTDLTLDELCFKFDSDKLDAAYLARVNSLVDVIIRPDKAHDAPIASVNYSECALTCKNILRDIAKTRVIENPNDIRFSKEKIVYVEGCAGSGKTRLIADQINKLHPKSRNCVQVWTFTNESVKDIKKRLKELVPDASIRIETLSSWCSQQLKGDGVIKGKVIKDVEAHQILQKIIDDLKPDFVKGREITGEIAYGLISHSRSFDNPDLNESIKKVSPKLSEYSELLHSVYERYQDIKKLMGRTDFDGLIELIASQVSDRRKAKKYLGNVKYIFVDEVQDLNRRQWAIINILKEHNYQIMVVGDPAQSIYQFRGATPQILNSQNNEIYRLRFNYRSTQAISNVTNKFRKRINPKFKNAISEIQDGPLPRLVTHSELKKAMRWILNDIKSKNVWNTRIFILCRFNKEKDELIKACDKKFKDGHKIKVMTFHASKGQQAKTVYVLDPRFRWMGFTDANEELCNMYVALSRAEENLTIIRSTSTTVDNSRDNYMKRNLLDQLDENICEII